MFPIRDHNPSNQTPYVTFALIAANVLVFISYFGLFADPQALQYFFLDWALIPDRVSSGQGLHTLFTSIFMHGGLLHLAGNMLFLWIFGDNLEEDLGHLGFLLFYLACGIGASLAHVFAAPWSEVPTVGASGAIAGVMGGYLLMYPRARVDVLVIFIIFFRVFPLPAWLMLGVWFGIQLISGATADMSMGGVAYWAHAGGFVLGLAAMIPVWLSKCGPGYWARTHGHPDHPEATYRFKRTHVPNVKRRR